MVPPAHTWSPSDPLSTPPLLSSSVLGPLSPRDCLQGPAALVASALQPDGQLGRCPVLPPVTGSHQALTGEAARRDPESRDPDRTRRAEAGWRAAPWPSHLLSGEQSWPLGRARAVGLESPVGHPLGHHGPGVGDIGTPSLLCPWLQSLTQVPLPSQKAWEDGTAVSAVVRLSQSLGSRSPSPTA